MVAGAVPAGDAREQVLSPVDAATNLLSWGPLTLSETREAGDEPLTVLTLTRGDGRALSFEEANHAPHDLMAQAPGGPLAQAMGFFADEAPTLYHARASEGAEAPFLCAPEGPTSVGIHKDDDSRVTIVALKGGFEFIEQDNGEVVAAPFSPDMVCARMKFTAAAAEQ